MNARFRDFRQFLLLRTGIQCDEDREYLIRTRLSPLLPKYASDSIEAILERAMSTCDPELTSNVIESMLTGETLFFRDKHVFDALAANLLPSLMDARRSRGRLRIWCAACSTGQEPYSIAMMLEENAARLKGWRIEILASDVSGSALATAQAGVYNQFEVQRGLPVGLLLRHFGKVRDRWQISERIRSRVEFRQVNLIHSFSELGPFDVIFCRNVLMYFAASSKHSVTERLCDALEPGGLLFLGATENVCGHELPLERDLRAPGAYWRNGCAPTARRAPALARQA